MTTRAGGGGHVPTNCSRAICLPRDVCSLDRPHSETRASVSASVRALPRVGEGPGERSYNTCFHPGRGAAAAVAVYLLCAPRWDGSDRLPRRSVHQSENEEGSRSSSKRHFGPRFSFDTHAPADHVQKDEHERREAERRHDERGTFE